MVTHTTSAGCLVVTFLLVLLFLFMHSLQLSSATTFTVSSNTSSCFKVERNALLDLKHSLVDESNSLSSWTGDDCCNWYGIRCSRRTGHVVKLDLSYLNLSKANNWFPSLNLLPSLSVLNLHGCGLDFSKIPAHSNINFTSLSELDLGENMYPTDVTTTVPHWLFNITGLVKLNLGVNNYHGPIPETFGTLRSLNFLDLSGNSFTSLLPNTLSKLSNLLHLDLSYNEFKGPLPAEMGNLTQLRYLNLYYNNFTGNLPPSFEKLSFLESLDIGYNQLSGNIPPFIGQLIKLQELDLRKNQLSGNIPPFIGQLIKLQDLDLGHNGMSGIISENHFHNLTSLEYLYLSYNPGLVTNFSSTWTPTFQLIHLGLHSCKVGPRFPRWISNQRNLTYLDLSNASIADNIPHWFSSLSTNIQELYLSDNKLKGNSLSIHPNLEYLDVSNNLLSELLVANATNSIQNLEYLYASNNLLSGAFPSWLCNSKSIIIIDLSNNQLSGRLPSCVGSLVNLGVLDLTNNSFLGSIPSSLGSLPGLISLSLHNNKFEGYLPSSFQNLTTLILLDVGKNVIDGVIPLWIGEKLSSLRVLILQSNRFNGPIPQQLCWLSNLQTINFASNNISGSIPICFSNLSSMVTGVRRDHVDLDSIKIFERIQQVERPYKAEIFVSIDLSNNNITGAIPDELMGLLGLLKLNVSGNHIEGRIPHQIGNLRQLLSLDLSRNKLSGPIPESLSNLYFLVYLNLSFNDLSGKIPTGRQLQTLTDPASYMGNMKLCGAPLNPCPSEHNSPDHSQENEADDDDENVEVWFYSGMGPGILVGFLGFCGALHFNKRWRYAYFGFFEYVYDILAVAIAVKAARLRRKFQKHRTQR